MRPRVAHLLLLTFLLGFLVALTLPAQSRTAGPARAELSGTAPERWARECDRDTLGLGSSSLELAPILADDKGPDGGLITRTPDSRGRFVPVVFVHGWTSRSTHVSERSGAFSHVIDLSSIRGTTPRPIRSLIAQVQGLPGAVAFTYDYHDTSGRWVTDDSVGPGLGRALRCLHRASGEKVIVVGHSMGGLAVRQAVGRQKDGTDRSDSVSTVVTFGTPETGSVAALLTAAGVDVGTRFRAEIAVLRMILAACGADSSVDMESGSLCSVLPGFLRSFDGDAGRALRAGSRELRDLPAFPSGVDVVALAGSARFAVPADVFLSPRTKDVDVGDLIVTSGSAKDGADRSEEVRCRYQLNPVRGLTDGIGLKVRLLAESDAAGSPIGAFTGPCFHNSLMRDVSLTNEAMGTIDDDIASRQDQHGALPQAGIDASEIDDPEGTRTPVLVVLDTSGSMADEVPAATASGSAPKIDAARTAVLDLIDSSHPDQELGIIAYPGGDGMIEGCSSGRVVTPVARINKTDASLRVRSVTADGDTPTAPALFHAGELLQRSGALRGVIVLISDGESNCGETTVCETADVLRSQGFALTVNTVGFDISADSEAADELRCVAEATGGVFLQAGDAQELRDALAKAAGAYVSVDAKVPSEMPSVVGGGSAGETATTVKVLNESKSDALDVRVALDFLGNDGVGGALLVPRPVRFLGNLAPGESRTVSITVHPDASLEGKEFRWLSSVTSRNGAAALASGRTSIVRPAVDDVGSVLEGVQRPVVMGDSYSAGEGAGDYVTGTDFERGGNACHQSRLTYAAVLFPDARNLACSGAVTGEVLWGEQESGGAEVGVQIDRLEDLVEGPDIPDAVFLTIGGNDIGFGDVAFDCTRSPRCSWADTNPLNFGLGAEIDHNEKLTEVYALGAQLVGVYQSVDAVLNSPAAVRRRGGEAPVVVLPYSRITPRNGTGLNGCQLGFNTREFPFLNALVDALNLTIRVAVGQAADRTRPVYYVDDVVEAFQPSHTICDGDESYAVARGLGRDVGALLPARTKQETAHPNRAGYAAQASAIAAWSRSVTPVSTVPLTEPPPRLDLPTSRIASVWDSATRWSAGPLHEDGSEVSVSGSGFRPGSTAVVWLESSPRVLGAARVDEDGEASVVVRLPRHLPLGRHHAVLVGSDAGGASRTVSRSVVLLPQYTAESLLVLLLGLALTARALKLRRRARTEAT